MLWKSATKTKHFKSNTLSRLEVFFLALEHVQIFSGCEH